MIEPAEIIGLRASFRHGGKNLVGIIDAAQAHGFAEPGHIPDMLVTVRGVSGKTVVVSMVESYMTLTGTDDQ